MRLSIISWIIKTKVCVICLSLRLRQITQTRDFDNSWYHAQPHPIIVYYYTSDSLWKIWLVESIQSIHNSLWTWHDKCNISCRYCIYHVKFTSYCELIECSRPIRFFVVSLMYNNSFYLQSALLGWFGGLLFAKGWFSLTHKHKHRSTYADAVRCWQLALFVEISLIKGVN